MSTPSLAPGTRLGPYEVQGPLGEGGMGEVYRAHDVRLKRDVAIKIVRGESTPSEDARKRFEREAQAVAALSHPNILAIHDFGTDDGRIYAVMELLEGETLRARLDRGPLPWRKAVELAAAVADGLAAAHAKGIVHRDLKPQNLFLTADGRLKILDFGLAKLRKPEEADYSSATRSQTQPGRVLGTAGYMSPEQVAGRPVDARTDVFSLGCVLHEMVSGRRAFDRPTAAEAMAAILNEEPPELEGVPAGLRRLVRHCVEKDPEARRQSARDLAFDLRALVEAGAPAGSPVPRPRRLRWASAIAGAAFALALLYLATRPRPAEPPQWSREPVRLTVAMPEEAPRLQTGPEVSPDGRRIAFAAQIAAGLPAVWVRSLDAQAAVPLEGTAGAVRPFWSPDGRSIAFVAGGKLKRIDVAGGPARVLCDAPSALGAAWSPSGVIVFSVRHALMQVPDTGGPATSVATPDPSRQEDSLRSPRFLPDGRRFLFVARSGRPEQSSAYVGSLDSKQTRRLFSSLSQVVYAPPGYLLFVRDGVLLAQRVEPDSLRLVGEPEPVVKGVQQSATGVFASFSVSTNGVLAYRGPQPTDTELRWRDRSGRLLGSVGPPSEWSNLRIAPDGKRVAADELDNHTGTRVIWVLDVVTGARSRLTFTGSDWTPVWSPDGRQILFSSYRDGLSNIYRKPTDGSGVDEPVLVSNELKWVSDWSSDGRHMAYHTLRGGSGANDAYVLPLFGDRRPIPIAATPANEELARFSPDGRWIAYMSDESRRNEVYVQPFPPTGAKRQVSTDGGSIPRWRGDGREIFYLAPDRKIIAVAIGPGATFEIGPARPLFQVDDARLIPGTTKYDVTRDGQRFLVNSAVDPDTLEPIFVVLNWTAGLPRAVDR